MTTTHRVSKCVPPKGTTPCGPTLAVFSSELITEILNNFRGNRGSFL